MPIEPDPVITTNRVVLRPWCAGDEAALTAIYGDPLSAQYIEVPRPYDVAQATELVQRARRSRTAGTSFHYAVTLQGSGTVVGSAYLHDCNPADATTDVSYLIHPDHRGHGLAAAALDGLTNAALASGFRQVFARITPGNRVSEAVARRAGFRLLQADAVESCWHKEIRDGSGAGPVRRM